MLSLIYRSFLKFPIISVFTGYTVIDILLLIYLSRIFQYYTLMIGFSQSSHISFFLYLFPIFLLSLPVLAAAPDMPTLFFYLNIPSFYFIFMMFMYPTIYVTRYFIYSTSNHLISSICYYSFTLRMSVVFYYTYYSLLTIFIFFTFFL